MSYHVCKKLLRRPKGKVIRDDLITLKTAKSKKQYPQKLRRVEMLVEVDGKEVAMVFITNHLDWAASSVGELYQARWGSRSSSNKSSRPSKCATSSATANT